MKSIKTRFVVAAAAVLLCTSAAFADRVDRTRPMITGRGNAEINTRTPLPAKQTAEQEPVKLETLMVTGSLAGQPAAKKR